MRAAVLGVAICVLAAACSLVPPIGTRPVEALVTNTAGVPLQLAVETREHGVIAGAVRPSSLPAGAQGVVMTFFLPQGDDWWISANGVPQFPASDTNQYVRPGCGLFMEIGPNGSGGIGCGS